MQREVQSHLLIRRLSFSCDPPGADSTLTIVPGYKGLRFLHRRAAAADNGLKNRLVAQVAESSRYFCPHVRPPRPSIASCLASARAAFGRKLSQHQPAPNRVCRKYSCTFRIEVSALFLVRRFREHQEIWEKVDQEWSKDRDAYANQGDKNLCSGPYNKTGCRSCSYIQLIRSTRRRFWLWFTYQ